MKRVILYPYKIGSESARDLSLALRVKGANTLRVRPDGNYKPRRNDLIINWGNSNAPNWGWENIHYNIPVNVNNAANKLEALFDLQIQDVPIPEVAHSLFQARRLIEEGKTILCRTVLNGHSGKGIVIARTIDELVEAPLYTVYKKKRNEYRVHVFNQQVLDVQEKRRNSEVDRTADQSLIRSHQNGWVFCREDVNATQELKDISKAAVKALGLSFGAVDVIYNEKENKYYVLEVNTAPGLSGTTLEKYVDAIVTLASQ